ncbi:hypothetical protein C0992_008019 [Termitomyces sp. T32_za158]|nr:hypothetical protein C0992_008019 [Termitomyces sp. T32_za158]
MWGVPEAGRDTGRLLPSITIHQGPPEISRVEVRRLWEEVEGLREEAREEARVARQERDEAAQARDTLLRDCNASLELLEAQAEEVEQLRAQLTREAAGSLTRAPGFVAPSAQEVGAMAWGLRQANKSESHWHDWLLREVAVARLGPGAPVAPGWSVLRRILHGGGAGGAGNGSEGGAGGGTPVEVDGGAPPPFLC